MPSLYGPSELQKPVSERRLAVINMCDNRKVSNPFRWELAQVREIAIVSAVLARMRTESMAIPTKLGPT